MLAKSASFSLRSALNSESLMLTDYAESGTSRKAEFRSRRLARDPTPFTHADMKNNAASPKAGYEFLRAWRKSRNLTLEQLAEQMQNGLSTVSDWETGEKALSIANLKKLAALYGVHPAALLLNPNEAEGKITRMQAAAGVAGELNDEDAEMWLSIGRRMLPPKS
jgi:transcriptional regulator with XRE-family HTH domain